MYWASVPMSGHVKGPLSGLVVHGTMLCLLRASLPHIHDASKVEVSFAGTQYLEGEITLVVG